MAPLRGWAPRGERLLGKAPFGHWNTMTFIAALRTDRVSAPWIIDGPINAERFLDRRFSFSAMVFRITDSLHKFEARISPASVNRRLTKKILDTRKRSTVNDNTVATIADFNRRLARRLRQ
ncbi:hypothetical protein JOH51_001454 [Rhizobium leguminosarum]|nr:hypothetical protein [Rhizobium leguminosarum]